MGECILIQYDFDAVVDRRNTNSLKHDFAVEHGLPADVLPLWVADMDFRAPQPVLDALERAVRHGIFGYSEVKEGYARTLAAWFLDSFGWEPKPEWLVKTPGVVYALATAVRALTEPGDSVLIQPPVYHPFFSVVRNNGRVLVENRLVYRGGRYEIDFEDFEAKIVSGKVKLFILCSPHNPIGRVWTREELQRMGSICREHGVMVISDEIHCDFTLPGHPHTVFAQACPEMEDRIMVCTAPSKTFNLAGLQASGIWIPDAGIRKRFCREMSNGGISGLNTLGLVACQAAYAEGREWLQQLKVYLQGNLEYVRTFLQEKIPGIRLVEPEGTYFAWLDCTGLGLDPAGLNDLIVNRARLWLESGEIFGGDAQLFQRVVLACPRATLQEAMERLERAVRA